MIFCFKNFLLSFNQSVPSWMHSNLCRKYIYCTPKYIYLLQEFEFTKTKRSMKSEKDEIKWIYIFQSFCTILSNVYIEVCTLCYEWICSCRLLKSMHLIWLCCGGWILWFLNVLSLLKCWLWWMILFCYESLFLLGFRSVDAMIVSCFSYLHVKKNSNGNGNSNGSYHIMLVNHTQNANICSKAQKWN